MEFSLGEGTTGAVTRANVKKVKNFLTNMTFPTHLVFVDDMNSSQYPAPPSL